VRRVLAARRRPAPDSRRRALRSPQLTSPGRIAVICRWATWAVALALIASSGHPSAWRQAALPLALTLTLNILLTLAVGPYVRLLRRYPAALALDVLLCLAIANQGGLWSTPFQLYSYASLLLPIVLFSFRGALAGSALYLALELALLYAAGFTFTWAMATHQAAIYLLRLAGAPLVALAFAYPSWLFSQLRDARQRLAWYEREQLQAAERLREAQALHGEVAQKLFGIGTLAEGALARLVELGGAAPADPRGGRVAPAAGGGSVGHVPLAEVLRQVSDLARQGSQRMRRALYALNGPGPTRRGLAVSLRALLADLTARTGAQTHFAALGAGTVAMQDQVAGAELGGGSRTLDASARDSAAARSGDGSAAPQMGSSGEIPAATPAADPELPEAVADALYRVAREALANVERHAGAPNVWVELAMRAPETSHGLQHATLVVRDDGCGFRRPLLAQPGEPDEDELGHLRFGLGNMRRAVESVGGRLEVTTGPGRGTMVTASVPVPAASLADPGAPA
jgi:signal transduction histidine kinase